MRAAVLTWLATLTAPQAAVLAAVYSSLFAAAGWLVPKLFEAYIQARREKQPQLLVDFERPDDVPKQIPELGVVRVLEITRRMFGKTGPGLRLIQGKPGSKIVWEGKAHGLALWQRVARCVVTNITGHELVDTAVYINAGMFQAVVETLDPSAASAGRLIPSVAVVVTGGGPTPSAHRLHHGALVARNDFEVIIRRLQPGESFEFYVVNVSGCFADVGPLEFSTTLIVGQRKRSSIQAIRTKNQFEQQRFVLMPPDPPPEHEAMWPLMQVEVKEEN